MNLYRILIFVYLVMSPFTSFAQDLSEHRWKDRLVILQANDLNNQLLKEQILELRKNNEGLKDRQIIVYQIIQNKYQKGIYDENEWKKSEGKFTSHNEGDSPFQFTLIGLDGGIKLKNNEPISCEKLFGTIDQMPMRQSEIRRKKDGDNF